MATAVRSATEPDRGAPAPRGAAAQLAPLVERFDSRAPGGRRFGIRLWDGSELPPGPGAAGDAPWLVLRRREALRRILGAPGELGLSRAWVAGDLDVDGDLFDAMALTEEYRHGAAEPGDLLAALRAARRLGVLRHRPPPPPAVEARLRGRLHSAERDRAAISHHYDISNEMYRAMLGPTMVYSCAYYASDEDTLDSAQTRKLDLICRKLELREGERLLDIGCGWGSLLIHAARDYGVRGVGVTISEQQAALARERVRDSGLADRIEIRLQDYRDVTDGPYDKIASIGMFEHVGREQLARYFGGVRGLLAPHGLFLNHGIVRTAPQPMGDRSFTRRYVFPDGELHTQGVVIAEIEAAGMELRDDESLRPHYARTLRDWATNLDAWREQAIAEIGAERERVWRLHNAGASLAFARGTLSVHQVIAAPLRSAAAPPLRVRAYPV
jgi:cyclopropane-fatty-acyl-phospholipid synthase